MSQDNVQLEQAAAAFREALPEDGEEFLAMIRCVKDLDDVNLVQEMIGLDSRILTTHRHRMTLLWALADTLSEDT